MNEALKEYSEGMKSASYIANKYNIDVMKLHQEYAKLANSGQA